MTSKCGRKRERARAGIEPTAAAPSQPDCPGVSRSDHSAGSKESASWRALRLRSDWYGRLGVGRREKEGKETAEEAARTNRRRTKKTMAAGRTARRDKYRHWRKRRSKCAKFHADILSHYCLTFIPEDAKGLAVAANFVDNFVQKTNTSARFCRQICPTFPLNLFMRFYKRFLSTFFIPWCKKFKNGQKVNSRGYCLKQIGCHIMMQALFRHKIPFFK